MVSNEFQLRAPTAAVASGDTVLTSFFFLGLAASVAHDTSTRVGNVEIYYVIYGLHFFFYNDRLQSCCMVLLAGRLVVAPSLQPLVQAFSVIINIFVVTPSVLLLAAGIVQVVN